MYGRKSEEHALASESGEVSFADKIRQIQQTVVSASPYRLPCPSAHRIDIHQVGNADLFLHILSLNYFSENPAACVTPTCQVFDCTQNVCRP